jgi:hypothetical protein
MICAGDTQPGVQPPADLSITNEARYCFASIVRRKAFSQWLLSSGYCKRRTFLDKRLPEIRMKILLWQ